MFFGHGHSTFNWVSVQCEVGKENDRAKHDDDPKDHLALHAVASIIVREHPRCPPFAASGRGGTIAYPVRLAALAPRRRVIE